MQNYLLEKCHVLRSLKQDMKSLITKAQTKLIAGGDVLLPPRCPVTGEIVDAHGMISSNAWTQLDFVSAPFCKCCGIPFGFETGEGDDNGMCISCLDDTPIYNSARAALIYNDCSRDLILGFKHGDKMHNAPSFVPWLTRVGADMLEHADFLIPVPLHPLRLISRRYNQAAIMADALSKSCGIEHLPLALRRTRSTPSQGHMKTVERTKNVSKAFDIAPKYRDVFKGKTLVLIDDVYTTGATVNECTKTLRKYGTSEVHILTLARVLKD